MPSLMRTIIVADPEEINRIANFSSGIGASVSSTYAPVLSSKGELVVFQEGKPILKYRSSTDSKGEPSKDTSTARQGIGQCLDYLRKEKERHVAGVFLDDSMDGRHIEFDFLLNGLKRGTTCIYVLPEEDPEPSESITNQMEEHVARSGYPVRLLERFGVYKVADPAKHPFGLEEGVRKTTEGLLRKAGPPPYTIAGHYTPRWDTKESIECNRRIEEIFHVAFPKLNGSTLCSYYSEPSDPALALYWKDGLLRNHHIAVVLDSKKEDDGILG